jgi:F420-dependent oxidoreductase-like protein
LDVSQHRLEWKELLRRVRYAEDAGFDGVWLFDHFRPLYGRGPGPCFEAWTSLSALGAATSRVRLGILVTGITYRHPSVLASEVVTADHVSDGRVDLGMGAAWHGEEHRALGIDFPPTAERVGRLEEGLEVMRLLMTKDDASFDGRYFRLRGATYRPRPVQEPHPPIWIGASGRRRMLPLAGRWADVWHTFGSPREAVAKATVVDEHAERAGRDPASIARASSLSLSERWDQVRRTVDAWREAGFSYLVCSWPSEGQGRLDEFVHEVMADVTTA